MDLAGGFGQENLKKKPSGQYWYEDFLVRDRREQSAHELAGFRFPTELLGLSAANRRSQLATFSIRRVNPVWLARVSCSSIPVNACLLRITRIEFATPIFSLQGSLLCQQSVRFAIGFCANSDRGEFISDRNEFEHCEMN